MRTKSLHLWYVVVLALLVALPSTNAARAQEPVTTQSQSPSVVFQGGSAGSALDQAKAGASGDSELQFGFGAAFVFQAPQGSYATDHGNKNAFGFSLQLPVRRSREWNFLPTYTVVTSTPGPSTKQAGTFGLTSALVELEHKTTSVGLDVHWRGREPGSFYLLLGAGSSHVTLEQTRTQCVAFFSCRDAGANNLGSKTAPYAQIGFGIDSGPGGVLDAGLFLEVRAWRGPYLQPNFLADGTPTGAQARTGNAVVAMLGIRMQGASK